MDEEKTTAEAQGTNGAEPDNTNGTEPEKTFTQEQVNQMIADRVAREKRNLPSDVDMKEFREWKKSRQTDAEKLAALETELEKTRAELIMAQNMSAVSNADCRPEFTEFVTDRVSKMEGDFEKNLASYKKQHPQYFGVNETVRMMSSSPRMSGGSAKNDTFNARMNDALRRAVGKNL